jgi:hypothetical protein
VVDALKEGEMPKVPTKTKVTRRETHDNLSLAVAFPDGSQFRWSISRSGERLATSTSFTEAQIAQLWAFIKKMKGTYSAKLDRLSALAEKCSSRPELLQRI